jgi:hypothetical protein
VPSASMYSYLENIQRREVNSCVIVMDGIKPI